MDTAKSITKGIIENLGMERPEGEQCHYWIQIKGITYIGLCHETNGRFTPMTLDKKPLVKDMYVQFAEQNLQITPGTLLIYEPTPTERHCLMALAMAFKIMKPTMSTRDIKKKCASLYEVLLELLTR